jgi:hypothetical protein
MKKVLFLVLGGFIIVVGFLAFTTFYAKKQVDRFFTSENEILYSQGPVTWKLASSASGLFNSKYNTELLIYNKNIISFEHKTRFGLTDFNIFNIGSIDTTATLSKDLSEDEKTYAFNFLSNVTFSGIDSKIHIKEGSKQITKEGRFGTKELFDIAWKDINIRYFVPFKRDLIESNADIPYLSFNFGKDENDNISIVIENQKYSSLISKKKLDFWLGESTASIDAISISDTSKKYIYDYEEDEYDYEEYDLSNTEDEEYSDSDDIEKIAKATDEIITTNNIYLSGFHIKSNVEDAGNSNIASNTKVSLKNIVFSDEEENVTLGDMVFDISLENIDLHSAKEFLKAFEGFDFTNKSKQLELGLSLIEQASNMLRKHPQISLNEFSGKYEGQEYKANGFVKYIGNGGLQYIMMSIDKDLEAKLDLSISDKLVRDEILKDYNTEQIYYGEDDLESKIQDIKDLGFKIENGVIKGVIEYKNSEITINGKTFFTYESFINEILK